MEGNNKEHTNYLLDFESRLLNYINKKDNNLYSLFKTDNDLMDNFANDLIIHKSKYLVGLHANEAYDKLTLTYMTNKGTKTKVIWDVQG